MKTFLFILLLLFVTTSCAVTLPTERVRGSGRVVIEERDVSGFNSIWVTGAGRVFITQGNSESLTIETDDNLLEFIETRVRGKTLEIGFTDDTVFSSSGGRKTLEPSEGFIFRIGVKDLKAIILSGATRVEMGQLTTDGFDINLSGAGDIKIDGLNANRLDVLISGAGGVEVGGEVEVQDVRLSGLGRYQAFDLESREAEVNLSGAGDAEVWVTDVLDVLLSGVGNVKYYGDPEITQNVTGVG
jgi:hypothetical protein